MEWAEVVAEVVAKAVGTAVPGSESIVAALVRAVLQVQDEQIQRLSRIEAKVDRLLEGPWKTSRLYLEEAQLPGRTQAQQRDALVNAAAKLREAVELQEKGSLMRTSVLLELATVLYLQGDGQLANHYAVQAAQVASYSYDRATFGGRVVAVSSPARDWASLARATSLLVKSTADTPQ